MSELEFLSPDRAVAGGGFAPRYCSPLERALRGAPRGIEDVSRTGKLEVRGDVGALDEPEVALVDPGRALVLCDYDEAAAVRGRLRARFEHVLDLTGALAGIRIRGEQLLHVRGEQLLRRLTDLDLDVLPARGSVAHVPALVLRDGDRFTLLFAQEYARYLAEVVVDAAAGRR